MRSILTILVAFSLYAPPAQAKVLRQVSPKDFGPSHGLELETQRTAEGSAVDDSALLEEQQAPTEVAHKSWFERLGDAVWSVLIGLFVVIPLSVALLWVNEKRAAQLETLLGVGQVEAETIEASEPDLAEYDGTLVHLNSESVKGIEPVQDSRFPDVKMVAGCIKLRSVVEVYQWEEEEKQETKKDNVGGGTTTVKSYHYKQAWCSQVVDSSRFRQSHGHTNTVKISTLQMGSQEAVNGLVKYGEPYRLRTELVGQLNNFQDAEKLVGNTLQFESYTFTRDSDGRYHYPAHKGQPDIGDLRVKVEHVLDGPATIMALQMQDKGGNRTFGPYRTVRHGICGGTVESELKHRRLAAAKKSSDEIYQEEKCLDFGPFCCLCACCNLVTFLFASAMPPQIYSVWPGQMSRSQCFDSEQAWAGAKKWGLRLFSWLLLWIGFNMLFEPLPVILDVIPFLGPWLGSGLSWMISVLSFLLTMALASLIVSIAYLLYRPVIGLMYLGITVGFFALIQGLGQYGAAQPTPVPT